jgi:very-short-patch-repair endonuclease
MGKEKALRRFEWVDESFYGRSFEPPSPYPSHQGRGKLRIDHLKGARQLGGAKFRRQTPIGPYIVDFASRPKDGNTTSNVQLGWRLKAFRVLRFWNNKVLNNLEGVLERTVQELEG